MKIEINETGKWQNSLTLKVIVLAIMGLFLLIPLEMIKSIIRERQKNSEDIKKEISLQWASEQTISGPVLNIPVVVYPADKEKDSYKTLFHILPESLEISGTVNTEKRHRSIYQSVVYTSDVTLSGEFSIPVLNMDEKHEILWTESYYTLGISDNRGLKGAVSLKTDSADIEAVPGLRDNELFDSGITFPAAIDPGKKKISFSTALQISGSGSMNFTPVGKTTKVNLTSSWNAPGFTGNFLPAERTIDDKGFKASWIVTNLNRNFPQYWSGNSYKPERDSFGTEFILQADHYQKALRSAKYGILFIALTFMALLFAEMTANEKISIFHYLEMALGLVLFFSMLNALSEHIGFNAAYLLAAISTIVMITGFLWSIIQNRKSVFMICGMLVFLYAFIFVLLTLKDYAYLAGNIGLFILLAITMRLSLKLKRPEN